MSETTCSICGAAVGDANTPCQACQGSADLQDLFAAAGFAGSQAEALHAQGLLDEGSWHGIQRRLSMLRLQGSGLEKEQQPIPAEWGLVSSSQCRQCGRGVMREQSFCAVCGAATGPRANRLRYLDFALKLIADQIGADVPAEQRQRCLAALQRQIEEAETELKAESAARGAASDGHSPGEPPPDRPAARSLVEILLDPHSIRWLLASGGTLLAVGMAIWLSSLGVFKSALVVASGMGVGTVGLLAAGAATMHYTRHRLAGRATALLGCLVMPLNLWFYNANHLMSVHGHLWVAALVCSILYGLIAWWLEDPTFVYVLFAGITMTGTLVLADLHRLGEVAAPATFMTMLGLIGLHMERVFFDDDGPFSRKRFGVACFISAQSLIGLAMVLLVGAQVSVWAAGLHAWFGQAESLRGEPLVSIILAVACAYGYVYSALVVRRRGAYTYLAAGCLAWAGLQAAQMLRLLESPAALIGILTFAALGTNLLAIALERRSRDRESTPPTGLIPLGACFGLASVAIGVVHLLAVTLSMSIGHWPALLTWGEIVAMVITAGSFRLLVTLYGSTRPQLAGEYLSASVVAAFVAMLGLLPKLGWHTLSGQLPVLMALPLICVLSGRFGPQTESRRALPRLGLFGAIGLIVSSFLFGWSAWIVPTHGSATQLALAATSLEALVIFALAAETRLGVANIYFAFAMTCGTIYQLEAFASSSVHIDTFLLLNALAGCVALIGQLLLARRDARVNHSRYTTGLAVSTHAMISLPMAAVILESIGRLADHATLAACVTPAILAAVALLASAVVRRGGLRRWYLFLAAAQGLLCLVVIQAYSDLSLPRKFEVFCVLVGLVLLASGYVIWYRTQDSVQHAAGVPLFFGALMAGLPPAVFAIVNRFGYQVSFGDELVLMTIAVVMFLSGIMCRIRATTLVGGGLLAAHLVTLIVFAGMKAQLAVGAYVTIGGGLLFATGVLLSIIRDRLLALPERIRSRKGLFRVLAWN